LDQPKNFNLSFAFDPKSKWFWQPKNIILALNQEVIGALVVWLMNKSRNKLKVPDRKPCGPNLPKIHLCHPKFSKETFYAFLKIFFDH
jgi:hypothetical protein